MFSQKRSSVFKWGPVVGPL